jgi:hypothetical protein
MAHVANNADDYASARLNKFFPGIVPSLDGQCVSLAKWFMQEMSDVPDPQAARGDARYVGKTLVAQGHAVEVPYADRRRGDLICYEYGTYGHIGVVLSGDRTFEENVNWPGVASKVVDGAWVYASRIGALSESWRHDQHIYRLNTYKEGEETQVADENFVNNVYIAALMRGTPPYDVKTKTWTDPGAKGFVGRPCDVVLQEVLNSQERANVVAKYNNSGGGTDYVPFTLPPLYTKK